MLNEDEITVDTGADDKEDGADPPVSLDLTQDNLVAQLESSELGKKALRDLVQQCTDEFLDSWEKNASYRKRVAEAWRVLYCDLPPKNKPYENCANAAIPLALQNVVRYTNKIYAELFGDWSNVFNFIPTNPRAELIAPIVSEHSNWQIRNRFQDFKRQQHRGLMLFAVAGDVVCHSYYDPIGKRNCHEILTCDDFVTPYTHVSTSPDFSDVPWVARRMPFFKTRLKAMKKLGWENVDEVIKQEAPEHGNGDASTELRDSIAMFLGEDPSDQKRGEYEIIQFEGWMELPGQPDEHYCQLIFDLGTRKALRLSVHEHVPHSESYRYEWQTRELQEYQSQIAKYQQAHQTLEMQQQALSSLQAQVPIGHHAEQPMGEHKDQLQQAQQQLPPPAMPDWMKSEGDVPAPVEAVPIHMFAHGVCLEPMLGNLGIGIGRIDAQLNIATNTVWSQFLDAATLGNGKTFITAGNVDFKSPFRIGPGVFNKAKNVMPSDLQNAFYELDFGGANPQLIQAAQSLMTFGEQASSTPDLMSGAPGRSGETARGIQTRVDQVNAMISVPAQKYADFVIQIMKNNCQLNRVFMRDEEIFYVNRFNEDMEMQGSEMVKACREFYDNEFEIELVADLQFKTRSQKVSEADEIIQLPNVMPEMQGNMAFKYQAVKESLKARGLYRVARTLLGPPPPLPVNTFGLPPGTPGTAMGNPLQSPMPPPGAPGKGVSGKPGFGQANGQAGQSGDSGGPQQPQPSMSGHEAPQQAAKPQPPSGAIAQKG